MDRQETALYGERAKARVRTAYSWEKIVEEYEKLFTGKSEKD